MKNPKRVKTVRKEHTVDEVLRSLSRKRDLKINQKTNHIFVLNGEGKHPKSNDIGIRSWGKIDFLVNHCGYTQSFTREL
jgi:hypothetical protein